MEDVDRWIAEVEVDFPVVLNKLHAKFYNFLEYKRSKTDKVTVPVVSW